MKITGKNKNPDEILYNRMFTKYYSPSDPIWEGDFVTETMFHTNAQEKIRQLLKDGYEVRTGYSASSIRDAHNYHIFWK